MWREEPARVIRFEKQPGKAKCTICGTIEEGCCIHEGKHGKKYAICNLCVHKLFGYGMRFGISTDVPFSGDSVSIHGFKHPWTMNLLFKRLRFDLKRMVKRTEDPIQAFLMSPGRFRRAKKGRKPLDINADDFPRRIKEALQKEKLDRRTWAAKHQPVRA